MPYDARAGGAEVPRGLRGRLVRSLDRMLGDRSRTQFVAVSEAVRASYTAALAIPADRMHVVPNAVDVSAIASRVAAARAAGAPEALRDPQRRPLVLNIARHVPQKGLAYLIDAFSRPPLLGKGCRLALVGTGGDTEALRARAGRAGLLDRVDFLGSQKDVAPILAAADVFAFPSLYEGLPVALLEALAAGLPVVASDIPEIREVTSADGADLVPPGDADALSGAIAAFLDNPARAAALAQAGLRRVREHFDLAETTRRFEAVLLAAAQDRRRATRT
jgi:glycosyltransferase involved in cell wall biosynthesis